MSASKDQYTQLAEWTTLVIDSGDLDSIKKFVPTDATTNPSLLLAACSDPKYDAYVQDVSPTDTVLTVEAAEAQAAVPTLPPFIRTGKACHRSALLWILEVSSLASQPCFMFLLPHRVFLVALPCSSLLFPCSLFFSLEAIAYGKQHGGANEADQLELAIDRLFINVGTEITKVVPGVVSTEVDSKSVRRAVERRS